MTMTLIRYTGDAPTTERAITGRGKRWWPGELRAVAAPIAAQLLASRAGFEVERAADASDLVLNNGGTLVDAGQSPVSGAGIGLIRTATIGDSIIGQEASAENYDPTALDPAVGSYTNRARGFVPLLNTLLGQSLVAVYRGGISGQTVSQIAAREDTVFSRPIDVLVENGGTNDVASYVTLYGGNIAACVSAVVASRIARWNKAAARGVSLVIALDCLPVGSSSTYTTAQKQALLRINALLRAEAANRKSVVWVDGTAAIVDPASAAGLVKAGMLYDNDRHPSAVGMWQIVMAAYADARVRALARPRSMVSSALDCVQSDASSCNILNTATGLVTGSTGAASGTGMSGTVVTGLTASRYTGSGASIAASIVAAPNGVGNAQRLTITGAAATDQVRALILTGVSLTELPPGTWVYFEAMVKVSSGVNLIAISIAAGVSYTGGSPASPLASYGCAASAADTGGAIANDVLTMVSEPVYLPAGATALSICKGEIYATFGGAGGAVLDIYQMRMIKL